MSLTTGSSEIGTSGLRTQTMGLNVGTSYLGSGGVRTSSVSSQTPYQAHVARMQSAAPNSSGYYTAQDYTASSTQAGLFADAFDGPLTYASPNVQASPTRVIDSTSGMAYAAADGVTNTAVGSAAQTVAAYTAVFRSPPGQATWSNYGGVLTAVDAPFSQGALTQGGTNFLIAPDSVRRNGVALSGSFDLAPIASWMLVTARVTLTARTLQIAAIQNGFNTRLHLAALLLWPTDPSAAEVQAAEQEMQSYYGPLIATNPS